MNEDEVLSKITRLLEKGCTMLATHHDCGAPLFRCQGEIVCPVCSFPDEPAKSDLISKSGKEQSVFSGSGEKVQDKEREASFLQATESLPKGSKSEDPFAEELMDSELVKSKARLRASLIARLNELALGIRSEQDMDRLKKLLDCAEGLLRVLRSM